MVVSLQLFAKKLMSLSSNFSFNKYLNYKNLKFQHHHVTVRCLTIVKAQSPGTIKEGLTISTYLNSYG
jgi:hypothetical protein